MGIILFCWAILQLLLYRSEPTSVGAQIFWSCYAVFEMLLPLAMLAFVIVRLTKPDVYIRKRVFWLTLSVMVLLFVFRYLYNYSIATAWASGRVIIYGVFVLVLIETIFRSGLIHINTKHYAFFTHSPLKMMILNKQKQAVLSSATALCDNDAFNDVLASCPEPMRKDENTLFFAAPIIGGYALWDEDITALNKLHIEAEESIRKLQAANAVLAEEEKIKQAVQEESEKTLLMTLLEEEISGHSIRLTTMIEQLESATDKKKATARVIMLLCYIKRRSNLFFREKETGMLPADELTMYLSELAEMAGYAEIKIFVSSELKDSVSVRHATVFCDLFYNVLYWASWIENIHIIASLDVEDDKVILRLLPSEDVSSFSMSRDVRSAIAAAGGTYLVKDLDGGFGLSLSFPAGGDISG